MTSATVVNDDDKNAQFSSPSKEIVSEDVEDAHTSSKTKQAETRQDIYDSDSGDSDCSVTSGFNSHLHGRLAFFRTRPVSHSIVGSAETTWTDEKHSSYLDSMEATFVQKMYDKEFCSLDVCGHSSHTSLTLDQECVESQPFCLNMRKPLEQRVAGLLTFRAPARPLSLVPSMLTSPWIRHFKSQSKVSLQNSKSKDNDEQHLHAKEVPKNNSVTNFYNILSEREPQSSYDSAYKKHAFASATQAGEYKKQKCQHFALSRMDILMEQQYNARKMGENKVGEDGQLEPKEHLMNYCKHKEAVSSWNNVDLLKNSVLKEQQELTTMSSTDIKPPPIGMDVFSQKPDQVVPSFQSVDEEAYAKIVSTAGLHSSDEEDVNSAALDESECVSNPSGSKTWTWSMQGLRHHVVKQTTAHAYHS